MSITLCHCPYLQCQDTLIQQNAGLSTVYEGLYDCNNTREISEQGVVEQEGRRSLQNYIQVNQEKKKEKKMGSIPRNGCSIHIIKPMAVLTFREM